MLDGAILSGAFQGSCTCGSLQGLQWGAASHLEEGWGGSVSLSSSSSSVTVRKEKRGERKKRKIINLNLKTTEVPCKYINNNISKVFNVTF